MNPLTIYQDALNTVSQAVLAGDFLRYAAMIDLPYLVHTARAELLVSTTADLRPTFDTLSQGLKRRGVTHYERVARAADYAARDRIEGWHHTHILANGQPVTWPHAARQSLVRRGQLWLFSEAHYEMLSATRWPLGEADIFARADRPSPLQAAQ